jgi:glycosyltransferase involved in cell wall biosynthesis
VPVRFRLPAPPKTHCLRHSLHPGVALRLAFLSIGRHIHTERWIRWFSDRGHECHLLTVQPGPVEGVTVHDIASTTGPKPLRYALSLIKVRRLLKEIRPDLLNTHFLTGYGYWGRFSGFRPNVLTVWGDDVYVTPFENGLKNRLARQALTGCDAVTGDSTDILDVAAGLGADPARSFRVLWGVDFEIFKPGKDMAWRQSQGFADDDLVYFSPRSYTKPYYNIDVIIKAAALVKRREPRARFLFSGYEGDPGPFRRRAAEAGIEDVMAMVGRLSHRDFATALKSSDVCISVPSVDATAVSLLEAMSCASGIIISSLPSSMEWISDGVSGLVVQPRDHHGLAEAMLRFADDPEFLASAGRAGLETARQVAGFQTNMEYIGAIFDHLVTGGPLPVEVSLESLRGTGGGS